MIAHAMIILLLTNPCKKEEFQYFLEIF